MPYSKAHLQLIGLQGFPLVVENDDLVLMISNCLQHNELVLEDGDILVIAQKIVSKSEGRMVSLASVEPGQQAINLGMEINKDPRLIELILSESTAVARKRKGLLIVQHKNGYVHANAGIDFSNVEPMADSLNALLLPVDPDASARALRDRLAKTHKVNLGVLINDSMGRAWRTGIVGQAIGCAGVSAVTTRIGQQDLFGRPLETTEVATGDELASAASVLMGQGNEGVPVVLIRGAGQYVGDQQSTSRDLLRDPQTDMFRDW